MHDESIKLLNEAVADELTAVHQYMYFHFHLDDLGYNSLAALLKRSAIDEMLHIEILAERVLFLGGDVELVPNAAVATITDVKAMLDKAKELEAGAVKMYNRFAIECGQNADSATKKIFEDLVTDEEGHWDQFDKQAEFIERFGESYLALQSVQGEPEAGPPA